MNESLRRKLNDNKELQDALVDVAGRFSSQLTAELADAAARVDLAPTHAAVARLTVASLTMPDGENRDEILRAIASAEQQIDGLLVIRENEKALATLRAARRVFKEYVLPGVVRAAIAAAL